MFKQPIFNEFYNEYLKKRIKDTNNITKRLDTADDFHDYLAQKGIKGIGDMIAKEIHAYIEEKQAQGEYIEQPGELFGLYAAFVENVMRSGMFYKRGIIPEIVTFQIQREEFYFFGKEYPRDADMGKVWDDFISTGGYEKNKKYGKYPYSCMVIFRNDPEHKTYFPGTIVEGMDDIPEGFKLAKFPACEFLVVTTEWLPTKEEALWQIYHDYHRNAKIPDGYIRYDGHESQIEVIEVEHFDTEEGSRWEFWVPIKKVN